MKISVAVLTKNGGERLKEAIAALRAQRAAEPFEIVAIDSGSTDGTARFLRDTPGVTFVAIAPHEFQHGATRNLAMRTCRGELVAFITQDAVPAGPDWLSAWLDFMAAHPEVAGAFGHQVPHPGADPLEGWEVTHHFGTLAAADPVMRAPPEGASPEERARSRWFSNVNSCVRKEAWMRIPFREIEFGEDQTWASDVHDAGLATAFCASAVVRHSHDYGPVALFRRRYDESRFLRRQFDYAVMPSWSEASRVAHAHIDHFRRHLDAVEPGHRLRNAWRAHRRAWASAMGNLAGTRLAAGEGALHRWLSFTERLRRTS